MDGIIKDIELLFKESKIGSVVSINKLLGDASNRSYYRCRTYKNKSYIVMVNAVTDKAIVSEEIAQHSKGFAELPFINIHKYLLQWHVNVPSIYYTNKSNSMLILQDLGDTMLGDIVKKGGSSVELYKNAIDMMRKFQVKESNVPDGCYARSNRFNSNLYEFEFNHFIEYGIEKAGVELPPNIMAKLKRLFHRLSVLFERYSNTFVHRDYHSRNLMYFHKKIYTIDFQDALIGPPHYDLASLLRDAYVELTDDAVDEMVDYYVYKNAYAHSGFKDIFTLISIQRMLKAAGRFRYIKIVKGDDRFMKYIPQLLERIKRLSISYKSDPSLDVIADTIDIVRNSDRLRSNEEDELEMEEALPRK